MILIEDGRIALDETINLARPRSQGDAAFAAIEKHILDRVLQKPAAHPAAADPFWPGAVAHGLRWRFDAQCSKRQLLVKNETKSTSGAVPTCADSYLFHSSLFFFLFFKEFYMSI